MLDTVFGLPTHPLVVHATVVIVPTAAAAVLLAAVWPRFRSWAGWGPPALAVLAVVLTPLSTSTGESLEHRVGETHLVEEHAQLADMLLWWVIPLALLAIATYALHRTGRQRVQGRALTAAVAVLPVLVALGTIVQVVLIGHSGARAAWSGVGGSSSSQVAGSSGD